MEVQDLVKNSIKIFKANKTRSFLTMLGIIIGISSVIIIMAVGEGAQSLILDQINFLGADLISVMPGYTDETGPPAVAYGITVTTLKKDDVEALRKIPEVLAITGDVQSIATVQYENQKVDTNITGTMAELTQADFFELESGRFFDKSEEEGAAKVAVLGYDIWEELFDGAEAVGQKIKIKKETFRVIGVIEERGVQGFDNQDAQVYIPLETAQKLVFGINYLHSIGVKVRSEKDVPYVVSQIEDIMLEQHNIDKKEEADFTVYTTAQALESLTNITNALKFFLSAIAAISLLVGGVGIMNIMLVAINERTREIGLRKALGATPANIQKQFLIEAAIITMLGGILGIIFGALISGLVAIVANYLGYTWKFALTIWSILLGVSVSAGVGILFGWYPSKKASDLEPVKALHYE